MRQVRHAVAAALIVLLAGCEKESAAPVDEAGVATQKGDSPDSIEISDEEAAALESELSDGGRTAGDATSGIEAASGADDLNADVALAGGEAVPSDVRSECSTELSEARAALGKSVPQDGRAHDNLPFDLQRGPACGVFPADYGDRQARRADSTSQCNRAILAKALIECINWDLPALPEQLKAGGYAFRVVDDSLYVALKDAAAASDWLGYLNLVGASREVERYDRYPDYETIEWLAGMTSPPSLTFTVRLNAAGNAYPELRGERFFFHPLCEGEEEPCEGNLPVHAQAHIELAAVGPSCATNNIAKGGTGNGFGTTTYVFDHCTYHVVPVFDEFPIDPPPPLASFDRRTAEQRAALLEDVRYGERTMDKVREELFASYQQHVQEAEADIAFKQGQFFRYLSQMRKFPAALNDEPLPEACQGEAVDIGECTPPPMFKRYRR